MDIPKQSDATAHGKPEYAFKAAVEAGREAYEAGLGGVSSSLKASASSPLTAFLNN